MPTASKPRRRWFRFSLRSLLIFTVLVGLLMGWIVKERRDSFRQQTIGHELVKQGWSFGWSGPFDWYEVIDQGKKRMWSSNDSRWSRRLARQVIGDRVGTVDVMGHDLSPMSGLTNLQLLWARNLGVSDLTPLSGLTNLRLLNLDRTRVTDLTPLSELKNLQTIVLDGTQISDLRPLAGHSQLGELRIGQTPVSDLTPLAELKSLIRLDVRGTQVTKEQIDALQKVLPNCEILHDPFPNS